MMSFQQTYSLGISMYTYDATLILNVKEGERWADYLSHTPPTPPPSMVQHNDVTDDITDSIKAGKRPHPKQVSPAWWV